MRNSNVILGIVAGIAAGAALGVLLAPDSGANTRKKISDKSQGLVDDIKSRLNHLVNGFEEEAKTLREEASNHIERSRNKVADAGRKVSNMHS